MAREEIDDAEILDEIIGDLRSAVRSATDFDERLKLNDRLLKAIAIKARNRKSKKGKGFDLGQRAQ